MLHWTVIRLDESCLSLGISQLVSSELYITLMMVHPINKNPYLVQSEVHRDSCYCFVFLCGEIMRFSQYHSSGSIFECSGFVTEVRQHIYHEAAGELYQISGCKTRHISRPWLKNPLLFEKTHLKPSGRARIRARLDIVNECLSISTIFTFKTASIKRATRSQVSSPRSTLSV